MSLMSAMSVALSGIQVATSQMQLVSSNISNAGTTGYSRQTAILEAVVLGDDAGGTRLVGYQRATSAGTQTSLVEATSDYGYYKAQDEYMAEVESIFGTNTSTPTLSDKITEFATSWRELAASPESLTQQQQVIQDGESMAEEIRNISSQIEEVARQVRDDIDSTLSDLNSTLTLIKNYNDNISTAKSAGQPTGSMEDERDQLILKVASVVNVKVYTRDNGRIALYTPQGYQLLDAEAGQFSYDGTTVSSVNNPSLSLNNVLTGGSLQAAVDFRDTTTTSTAEGVGVLQHLRDQLDELCDAFTMSATTPTETFAYAYNPTASAGGDFFTVSGTSDYRMSFKVNASLLDGSLALDTDVAKDVVDTLNDSTRTFSAGGLTVTAGSYEKIGTSIISSVQQQAATISSNTDPAKTQKEYLAKKLANETGVNVDTELVALTTLENAYNASAKVISVINQLYDILNTIV